MGRSDFCCLCGSPRKPTQAPVESFGNKNHIVEMNQHRPMLPERWETATQLLVNVSMWRNGGVAYGETHMCDDCIVVGLLEAKRFVDGALRQLDPTALAKAAQS